MTHKLMIMLFALLAFGVVSTGCDEEPKQTINKKDKDPEQPDDDKLGHGTDKEVEDNAAKPSAFQGTWRIVKEDADNTPVVRVSIIQDEGAKEGSGDYITQAGLGEGLQNLSGTLLTMTSSGTGFSATFNPTADQDEVYTINATNKVDENSYSGQFTSKTGTYNFPVKILRAPEN